MKLIAHRGNLYGPNPEVENHPDHIMAAIEKGFDVEIDIWGDVSTSRTGLRLGHDYPQYDIPEDFLANNYKYLWIHCKNLSAWEYMLSNRGCFNAFWHTTEDYILTTFGYCWVYPNKTLPKTTAVAVMPEICDYSFEDLSKVSGICSDSIVYYKNKLDELKGSL